MQKHVKPGWANMGDKTWANCPNYGRPILRWPYYQDISHAGRTMGHCPWCMQSFPVGQDVPKHESQSLELRNDNQ